jgi:hypothetical protein
VDVEARLVAPDQVTINGAQAAAVTIDIRPAEGARTFQVGLELSGEDPALSYGLPVGSVLVTLSGPIPALEAVEVTEMPAVLDVTGLAPGRWPVVVQVASPDDTEVVSLFPEQVIVTVVAPAPSASPSASPGPSVPLPTPTEAP